MSETRKKACAYIGVESRSYELPEETSEEELIKLVEELNADESVKRNSCTASGTRSY